MSTDELKKKTQEAAAARSTTIGSNANVQATPAPISLSIPSAVTSSATVSSSASTSSPMSGAISKTTSKITTQKIAWSDHEEAPIKVFAGMEEVKFADLETNRIPINTAEYMEVVSKTFNPSESGTMETMIKLLWEGSATLMQLRAEDFEMFGRMSSHEYRKLFFTVTEDLAPADRIWIIILFTVIKSRPRVLKAMTKFREQTWYESTREFILKKMVQYTAELPSDGSKFAAVHVPHIMPSFTAICWVKTTKESLATAENMLMTLWACQLKLPEVLKLKQRTWEENFWNKTVKRTRNTVVNKEEVEKKFHVDFWETKASDNYPLFSKSGQEVVINTIEDLNSWIRDWLY